MSKSQSNVQSLRLTPLRRCDCLKFDVCQKTNVYTRTTMPRTRTHALVGGGGGSVYDDGGGGGGGGVVVVVVITDGDDDDDGW